VSAWKEVMDGEYVMVMLLLSVLFPIESPIPAVVIMNVRVSSIRFKLS